MEFADAAGFFNDDPVLDGYTDALLFYCHTTSHDDQTSSGATARRRTMTTEVDTVPPARGVVKLYGERWLVSDSNVDSRFGQAVRRSYSLKKSTGAMALLTPGQAATAAAGTTFYAQKEYFRDQANARTEADWDVMWNVFCPLAEAVAKGSFLRQDGVLLRVRNAYPSIDRFRIAEADQFDDDAYQAVTFTSTGAPNLRTGLMDTISLATTAIQTDTQKFYEFRTEGESVQKPGDRTIFVAKIALSPKVGAELTMLGEKWRVLAVVSELDSWALHARRV